MKLADWLAAKNLTVSEFAEMAGLDVSTAHRAAHHKVIPSERTVRAIMDATNGKVTASDFFEPLTKPPARRRERAIA
jgi:transcriptional regulator with XRE-family HTH domain